MPRAAFDAFKDHGKATANLLEGDAAAKPFTDSLAGLGVDLKSVTDKLLADGVKVFEDSFDELYTAIREKQAKILKVRRIGQTAVFSEEYSGAIQQTLATFEADKAIPRMWDKDASFWKSDAAAQKIIKNALGWLRVPRFVQDHLDEVTKFAAGVKDAGFEHVLVMGMGGSSLCVEVLNQTHPAVAGLAQAAGPRQHRPGDDPADRRVHRPGEDPVRRVEQERDDHRAVGLLRLLLRQGQAGQGGQGGRELRRHHRPRDQDGGGRPARQVPPHLPQPERHRRAVLGPVLLRDGPRRAQGARRRAVARPRRGRRQAVLARDADQGQPRGHPRGGDGDAGQGRARQGDADHPRPLPSLGLWIEQIIAESTGKEGKGILPVAGEPLGKPEVYGTDRVFVQVRTSQSPALADCPELMALSDAGHPVIDLVLEGVEDIGAEFFRWEIATPLAGKVIGINPFDQPNVQESKDNTKELLEKYKQEGKLTDLATVAEFEGMTLHADDWNKGELLKDAGGKSGRDLFVGVLKAHFARVKPGDYVAITQYIDETPARDEAILKLRKHLRDALKVATTTGYGPRFLHSTGQLHKGGSDAGVFLQMTADDGADVPIPDFPCGFATLVKAQSLGDFQSLASRHRRAVSLHLGSDVERGWRRSTR